MYVPTPLKMTSLQQAQDFIEAFSFGVIVSHPLQGTHLPFILDRQGGERGMLYSHFARPNPHWRALDDTEVLVIFSGPHAYISPAWYAKPPAVPTWNYAAVHVRGRARCLAPAATLDVIEQMLETYEPSLREARDIVTDAYRDMLLHNIVGFQVEIEDIEGKLKLGQQRSAADRAGVAAGLAQSDSAEAQQLLDYMREQNLGLP